MKANSDIQAQAAQWLVRRDLSGAADGGAFESWLAADPRHRAAYLRFELAWRQADRLRKMRPLDGGICPDLMRRYAATRPAFVPPLWMRVGVTMVVAAVAAWSLTHLTRWQSYATQVGGYQRVLLADGTTIEINTGTEIKVHLSPDRRRVRLLHGEASFKVARDANRPFEVAAAGTTIRAVGTEFNVRVRDPQQIEVVVTEGRVALTRGALPRDLSAAAAAIPTLSAGKAAVAKADGLIVRDVPAMELERRLAWQNGELILQGETLAQAVAEFNRYNRWQLSIADARLESLRVGGNFRATDVDSFVEALRLSFSIQANRAADGKGYVLSY